MKMWRITTKVPFAMTWFGLAEEGAQASEMGLALSVEFARKWWPTKNPTPFEKDCLPQMFVSEVELLGELNFQPK